MTPMSIGGHTWSGLEARVRCKSTAKMVISVRRCSKLAAESALSAFMVLNSRSRRWGPGWVAIGLLVLCSAVRARVKCAILGGLKDESRIKRVRGGVVMGGVAGCGVGSLGWIVWRRRKVDFEAWKSFNAAESWVGRC